MESLYSFAADINQSIADKTKLSQRLNDGFNARARMVNDVIEDFKDYKDGFFVTINSLSNDVIKFRTQLDVLFHWVNEYCYGRNYKRNERRFRIVGAFEVGSVNQGLHVHLVIRFSSNTQRADSQIEEFIRRKWYLLTTGKTKSYRYGTLVNVKKLQNVENPIWYITKNYFRQNQFNLDYF